MPQITAQPQADDRRAGLIMAAQEHWVAALTDLGGRNTLLYYKDRRSGTLDLGQADPDALAQFTATGSTRLTRLFRDVDVRADAIRRMHVIYRKARELLEERGIRAGYLAAGMARWDELFLSPAAPVLLRGLTITPTRARYDDFDLVLDDESEVNPVLLHKLASVYGAATEHLAGERGDQLRRLLTESARAAEVPGFAIADRTVIGTFTYAKLPMVRDLQHAGDLLVDSDVVAAIAGDPDAQELLCAEDQAEPLLDQPAADYSVLDADSSQRSAIAAVLSGRSLVIHGPPGTGKSQTIANLIAVLVARGRKVLFVAEKRAAIDAVLSRLKGVDLGDLVLDIHEGTRDRQRIARDLGTTLDVARQATPPDDATLRRLSERQRRLSEHVAALHEPHPPWGLTPFAVQSALLGIPGLARTPVRLSAPERITPRQAEEIRDDLREFARLGGFTIRPGSTPWFGSAVRTPADARAATTLVAQLASYDLPRLLDRHGREAAALRLRPPATYEQAAERMALYVAIGQTARALRPEVYAVDPRALAAAVAGTGGGSIGERRRLRKAAAQLTVGPARPSREELTALLREAAAQLAEWTAAIAAGPGGRTWAAGPGGAPAASGDCAALPAVPRGLADLGELHAGCRGKLDELSSLVRLPPGDVTARLAELAADEQTAWRLPRLRELAIRFDDLGLAPLLDDLSRREADGELAAAAFDHAWYSSILDQIRVRDPRYAAERGGGLDEVASEFRHRDVEFLGANRRRVRHSWAQRLREAQDEHPLQARVIRKQAALRRGHLSLRRLLDQAPDMLFALKPCWAMSPLMVSQVLPATRLFDVVIFDEASQIVPADAVPSIMRGHQIVVAGDDRQLPPTNFFRQVGDDDLAEDTDDLVSFGAGFESVLDALKPLLPTWPLTWHYRSRDERLVAFCNARIYGGALTTFPGVLRDDCLRHVVVEQTPEPGQEFSVTAEVARVVELILEHARARPGESLGVIALGIRHAERIDAALRAGLASDPELEAFFADDRPEPFFVKNLERVQGDERDAIILSIGYGKHPDGRMRYQWGPLLRDGGERRLNVAATRARQRLTLVSSFSSRDVDPDRLTKAGARMLAEYLEYAGSGGVAAAATGGDQLSPFETDVRDRLAQCGITVVPQFGVGGYRIDFAASHPDDADLMVLAIEADGASYRNSGSVRDRDRLRGEHLRRLGWSFHRIWSTSWFHDPESEVAKLERAYRDAVSAATALRADDGEQDQPEPAAARLGAAGGQPADGRPQAGAPARPAAGAGPGGQEHAAGAGRLEGAARPMLPPVTGSTGLPSAGPRPDSTAPGHSPRSSPWPA